MKFLQKLNDIVFGRGAGKLLAEASESLSDISNRGRIPVGPDAPPLKIIGLTGLKRSGKSEVAHYLQDRHEFAVMPFAKILKETMTKVYGLSEAQLYGDEKDTVDDRYDLTPRFIMQKFATEVAREVHPGTWVMAWERLLKLEQSYGHTRFVVDDVRFPNEVEAIRKLGGKVWRVVRPGSDWLDGDDQHVSEQPLPVTILAGEIINDSTLEELQVTVAAWFAAKYNF